MRFSRVVRASDSQCKVATVLGLIPASSDTVESEGASDEALLNKVPYMQNKFGTGCNYYEYILYVHLRSRNTRGLTRAVFLTYGAFIHQLSRVARQLHFREPIR